MQVDTQSGDEQFEALLKYSIDLTAKASVLDPVNALFCCSFSFFLPRLLCSSVACTDGQLPGKKDTSPTSSAAAGLMLPFPGAQLKPVAKSEGFKGTAASSLSTCLCCVRVGGFDTSLSHDARGHP